MSTLSISPAFSPSVVRAPRVSDATSVRLTRRGRIVVLLAFLVVAVVVMMSLGGWATATRDSGTPEQVQTIEVGPGDTLYKIAGSIAEPGKIREMVHHIQDLNALNGPGLVVGQKLAVPLG